MAPQRAARPAAMVFKACGQVACTTPLGLPSVCKQLGRHVCVHSVQPFYADLEHAVQAMHACPEAHTLWACPSACSATSLADTSVFSACSSSARARSFRSASSSARFSRARRSIFQSCCFTVACSVGGEGRGDRKQGSAAAFRRPFYAASWWPAVQSVEGGSKRLNSLKGHPASMI